MKPIFAGLAALSVAASVGATAYAGPASDALGRCLVQSSTGRDRTLFVQWFFAALSVNPEVQAYASTTKEQRVAVTQKAAQLLQRLVYVDCHTEAVAAIKQDGQQALGTSFEVFGRSAATELMSDPAVVKEMGALDEYTDAAKWTALMEEAKKK